MQGRGLAAFKESIDHVEWISSEVYLAPQASGTERDGAPAMAYVRGDNALSQGELRYCERDYFCWNRFDEGEGIVIPGCARDPPQRACANVMYGVVRASARVLARTDGHKRDSAHDGSAWRAAVITSVAARYALSSSASAVACVDMSEGTRRVRRSGGVRILSRRNNNSTTEQRPRLHGRKSSAFY